MDEKLIQVTHEAIDSVERSNKRLFISNIILIISFAVAAIFFFGFYFNYSWQHSQTIKNGEIRQEIRTGGK